MVLYDQWYVAAFADELQDEILARTFCHQPVVLYRLDDGGVIALEDRCCHRHLPLSKGKLTVNGLQCGYHGLTFDRTGACVSVPSQSLVPPGAHVRSYRTEERHGLIWIWMGDEQNADLAQIPDYHWINDPAWAMVGGSIPLKAHYMLSIDNLLDLTHEYYVHNSTLGAEAIADRPVRTERFDSSVRVTRWIHDEDPGPFWRMALDRDIDCDRWQIVNFHLPSHTMLDVGVAPAKTGAPEGNRSEAIEGRVCISLTPIDDRNSWYFWAFCRNFQTDDQDLDATFEKAVTGAYMEDVTVLEAQQAMMNITENPWKIDVNADAGQLAGRRLYDDSIRRQESQLQAAE